MRLNQYLSLCGVASRRKADELIGLGKIKVNNLVAEVGQAINPDKDRVTYHGNLVVPQSFVYYKYYKPVGVLSSLDDPHHQKTLRNLKIDTAVFPVGRLDLNSEGLILLTNDGELAQKIAHPKFGQTKEYMVEVTVPRGRQGWFSKLRAGSSIDGKFVKPRQVILESQTPRKSVLSIVLGEGIKREVRRLVQNAGAEVVRLKRVRIGNIELGNLKMGAIEPITGAELRWIKSL